jgi:hypothetical protein
MGFDMTGRYQACPAEAITPLRCDLVAQRIKHSQHSRMPAIGYAQREQSVSFSAPHAALQRSECEIKQTPASQREAGVRYSKSEVFCELILEASSMVARNAIDVGARNAQIVELTIVESGKLTNGLLVGSPLLESLTNVHLSSPVVYKDIFRAVRWQ